jgi:hypothetical protein
MKLLSRSILLLTATVAVATASLLAPLSAQAIMVGAESNGELVNSNRTPALQAIALDKMQKQGVQVVRGNWGWNEVATGPTCALQTPAQLADPENLCYNWTLLDSFVSQANARNIQVLISFTRVPIWVIGNPEPTYTGGTTTQFQTFKTHYAAFHTAAATRYKTGSSHGTIKYWTVFNEPNTPQYWKPSPNATRYAALFAETSKAIHAAFPGAQVAAGPTNPTGNRGIKPVTFIKQFQAALPKYLPGTSLRKNLNAWAHNPYPSATSQPHIPSAIAPRDTIGMATIQRLFSTLDSNANTRGLKVWATEFGWETSGNYRIPQARQAQYIAEAFNWLDSKNRVVIGISYGLTDPLDPNDWQSGTFLTNGTPKMSFRMFQRMVSVPQAGLQNRVKRNTMVKVWGRSNVNPSTGVLAMKRTGSNVWQIVPGQRRKADGSITANIKVTARQYQFSVYDKGNAALGIKAGYGLTRVFSTF